MSIGPATAGTVSTCPTCASDTAATPRHRGEGDQAAGADGVGENLDPSWLRGDPPWLELFEVWLHEALEARIPEPNAMVLGTVDADGLPVTRTVLCKGADADGITFFTGYDSDKGHDLAVHPHASVTFPWIALERQVHLRGPVEKVSAQKPLSTGPNVPADRSCRRRRRSSRVPSAAASNLNARPPTWLRASVDSIWRTGSGAGQWGGYRIRPRVVEFWQGRANRLHNRVRLTLTDDGWHAQRLQP